MKVVRLGTSEEDKRKEMEIRDEEFGFCRKKRGKKKNEQSEGEGGRVEGEGGRKRWRDGDR